MNKTRRPDAELRRRITHCDSLITVTIMPFPHFTLTPMHDTLLPIPPPPPTLPTPYPLMRCMLATNSSSSLRILCMPMSLDIPSLNPVVLHHCAVLPCSADYVVLSVLYSADCVVLTVLFSADCVVLTVLNSADCVVLTVLLMLC